MPFQKLLGCTCMIAVLAGAAACDRLKGGDADAASSDSSKKKKKKSKKDEDVSKETDEGSWTGSATPDVKPIVCDQTVVGSKLTAFKGYYPRNLIVDPQSLFWSAEQLDDSKLVFAVNKDGGDLRELTKLEGDVVGLAVWEDDVYVLGRKGDAATLFHVPREGGERSVRLEGTASGLAVHRGAALVGREGDGGWELVRLDGDDSTVVTKLDHAITGISILGDAAFVSTTGGLARVDLAAGDVETVPVALKGGPAKPIEGVLTTATHLLVTLPKKGHSRAIGVGPHTGGTLTHVEGVDPYLTKDAVFFVRRTPLGFGDWGPDRIMRIDFDGSNMKSIRSSRTGVGSLVADDTCVYVATGIKGSASALTAFAGGG